MAQPPFSTSSSYSSSSSTYHSAFGLAPATPSAAPARRSLFTEGSRVAVTATSTRGNATSGALAAATTMLMQTAQAERAATDARMAADTATTNTLASALKKIEELTTLVNAQDARIVALEQARTRELAAQNVTIAALGRRVAALEAEVHQIQKHIDLMKPALRHHYITTSGSLHFDRPNNTGNLLDQHCQMRRAEGVRVGETEIEKFLNLNRNEDHLWRVGWVQKRPIYD